MDNKSRNPFCGAISIFIETLTGTCFELRVSPFETVLSIKAKIQRLEGIPVSQQYLIWEGTELEDDFCLHDYSIKNDCTLRLVLALRGGPVNTRRITVDEPSFLDMADYIEASQEELLEELSISANNGKAEQDSQVTLLVYRNGDQINFFRVIDGEDGPLSPPSGSFRPKSYSEMEKVGDIRRKQKFSTSRLSENRITASKMKHLQNRMHLLKLRESSPSKALPKSTNTSAELQSAPTKKESREKCQEGHILENSVGTAASLNKSEAGGSETLRTDRLLKVLNDQRPSVPFVTPQIKSATSLIKPSRLPHELRSKISFNRHDMYLRSYGLIPLQRQAEEDDNDVPDYANKRVHDASAAGCRGNGDRNSEMSSSHHIWCKQSTVPTHTHQKVAMPQSCPFVMKDRSKRSPEIAHCLQNASTGQGLSYPHDSHLPPLLSNPSDLTKCATNTIGVASVSSHRSFPRLSQVPPDQTNRRCDPIACDDRHSQPDVLAGKETWATDYDRKADSNVSSAPVFDDSLHKKLGMNLMNSRNDPGEHLDSSAKHMIHIPVDHSPNLSDVNLSAGIDRFRLMPCYSRHTSRASSTLLPPVRPAVAKKKCFCCGKKTGLATSYICRCGKNFCASHRYAETHDCTFDYKSLGRQLLKESNPIVSAPKLPKI